MEEQLILDMKNYENSNIYNLADIEIENLIEKKIEFIETQNKKYQVKGYIYKINQNLITLKHDAERLLPIIQVNLQENESNKNLINALSKYIGFHMIITNVRILPGNTKDYEIWAISKFKCYVEKTKNEIKTENLVKNNNEYIYSFYFRDLKGYIVHEKNIVNEIYDILLKRKEFNIPKNHTLGIRGVIVQVDVKNQTFKYQNEGPKKEIVEVFDVKREILIHLSQFIGKKFMSRRYKLRQKDKNEYEIIPSMFPLFFIENYNNEMKNKTSEQFLNDVDYTNFNQDQTTLEIKFNDSISKVEENLDQIILNEDVKIKTIKTLDEIEKVNIENDFSKYLIIETPYKIIGTGFKYKTYIDNKIIALVYCKSHDAVDGFYNLKLLSLISPNMIDAKVDYKVIKQENRINVDLKIGTLIEINEASFNFLCQKRDIFYLETHIKNIRELQKFETDLLQTFLENRYQILFNPEKIKSINSLENNKIDRNLNIFKFRIQKIRDMEALYDEQINTELQLYKNFSLNLDTIAMDEELTCRLRFSGLILKTFLNIPQQKIKSWFEYSKNEKKFKIKNESNWESKFVGHTFVIYARPFIENFSHPQSYRPTHVNGGLYYVTKDKIEKIVINLQVFNLYEYN